MKRYPKLGSLLAGLCAGAVTGLLGAGGGMVLVMLLGALTDMESREIFSASAAVMLPVCLTALLGTSLPWTDALPYLIGGALGGLGAGLWGRKLPVLWLHRIFGALLLWGGVRLLWP